jgi:hypothetical protein
LEKQKTNFAISLLLLYFNAFHRAGLSRQLMTFFPLFVAFASTFLLLAEVLTYAFIDRPSLFFLFFGIPRAIPPFKDIYTLTINALCDRPLLEFFSHGSCSASFYGVDEGSFDYPLALFVLARRLPRFLFESPSLLAVFVISIFLFSCLVVFCLALKKPSIWFALAYVILIASFPFRYLLERGQLDIVTWTFVLLATISSFAFSNRLPLTQTSHRPGFPSYLAISALLRDLAVPLLIVLSVAFKGFNVLELFVLPPLLFLYNQRRACYIATCLAPVGLFSLYNPSGIGSVATAIQSMPGEIFGLNVSSSLLNNPYIHLFRITIVIFSFFALRSLSPQSRTFPVAELPVALLLTTSAASFIACYFLTTSANYKLVSISFYLFSMTWLTYSRNYLKNLSLRTIAPTLYIYIICIPAIYSGYRPYIASLQFISQEYIDLFLMPAIAGAMLFSVYSFFVFSAFRILRKALII